MPLEIIDSAAARENRKTNPFSGWGNRTSNNRVEPIAQPGFTVGFQLERGEKIFTIGSCFARNVEQELLRKGFELPMRDLFKTPAFEGVDLSFINNYGVPSIFNELSWALNPATPYQPEYALYEMKPGHFLDLHLSPKQKQMDWQGGIARRSAIAEAYRTITDCRVVIITLGLSEIWFDRAGQVYLNHTPHPAVTNAHPDRFELHVLSYEDVSAYLSGVMDLIQVHCRPDVRVLLTVSPVPLNATHRNQDVMVANTYSKSVLRTVAETFSVQREFVTYYPSYEGIILSDRKAAWMDDFVHVKDDAVAVQVSRMVSSYMPEAFSQARAREEISGATALTLAREARAYGKAKEFFAEFGPFSKTDHQFAMEHCKFLDEVGNLESAIAVLEMHSKIAEAAIMLATLYRKSGKPKDAINILLPHADPKSKSHAMWDELATAYLEAGEHNEAKQTAQAWLKATPSAIRRVNLRMGRLFKKEEPELSRTYFERAVAHDETDEQAKLELLGALVRLGDKPAAVKCGRTILEPVYLERKEALLALVS